jgi:hypothetical protein
MPKGNSATPPGSLFMEAGGLFSFQIQFSGVRISTLGPKAKCKFFGPERVTVTHSVSETAGYAEGERGWERKRVFSLEACRHLLSESTQCCSPESTEQRRCQGFNPGSWGTGIPGATGLYRVDELGDRSRGACANHPALPPHPARVRESTLKGKEPSFSHAAGN